MDPTQNPSSTAANGALPSEGATPTAELFSLEQAINWQAIVLRCDATTAEVGMADPSDLDAVDEIAAVLFPRKVLTRPLDPEAVKSALRGMAGATSPGDASADGQTARAVNALLERAAMARASDVHLEPDEVGLAVRFRIDGALHQQQTLPASMTRPITNRIKVLADIDVAERRVPQDGSFVFQHAARRLDVRVVTVPSADGHEATVLRLLDPVRAADDLQDLGFGPQVLGVLRSLLNAPHGLVAVVGPTGAGKTSTLASALRIVATPARKTFTVEDPVEYRIEHTTQVEVNNKAGLTFARALRSFLRADPDVIFVGEIRDRETADVALDAALTGHLVLASLHANSAPAAPHRLVEMGAEPYLVAAALRGVLAQRLVRRLCVHCRRPADRLPPEAVARLWGTASPVPVYTAAPEGCPHCSGTGYHGRIAVGEVMTVTDRVSEAIVARATARELEAIAQAEGVNPMAVDGRLHVEQGITSVDELQRLHII